MGIQQISGSTVSAISNNTIANLSYSASGTNAFVWGIINNSGSTSITGNTIRNCVNSGVGVLADATVGIYTSVSETVSQNTIYSLINPAASADGDVIGIRAIGTGTPIISRNLIYDLGNNNKTTNFTFGIKVVATNAQVSNNMISLGTGITNSCSYRCISLEGAGTYSVYFNSLVITGASSERMGIAML
ncbi:MAG: hypothetical protein IPP32_01160 [Bacteroidetes bacterium]|nr:hypothetical protein [Bacteroidota bacterium]